MENAKYPYTSLLLVIVSEVPSTNQFSGIVSPEMRVSEHNGTFLNCALSVWSHNVDLKVGVDLVSGMHFKISVESPNTDGLYRGGKVFENTRFVAKFSGGDTRTLATLDLTGKTVLCNGIFLIPGYYGDSGLAYGGIMRVLNPSYLGTIFSMYVQNGNGVVVVEVSSQAPLPSPGAVIQFVGIKNETVNGIYGVITALNSSEGLLKRTDSIEFQFGGHQTVILNCDGSFCGYVHLPAWNEKVFITKTNN